MAIAKTGVAIVATAIREAADSAAAHGAASIHADRLGLQRQFDLAAGRAVHEHGVARLELSFEQFDRERVDDLALQRALQRTRAERGIESFVREHFFRVIADVDDQSTLLDPLRQPLELDADDLLDLIQIERVEHDHVVDAVEELETEPLMTFPLAQLEPLIFRHPALRRLVDVLGADVRWDAGDGG